MRSYGSASIVLALLLACASLPGARADDAASRPDVKAGDRWTYRHINSSHQEDFRLTTSVVNVTSRAIQTISRIGGQPRDLDEIWTPDWEPATTAQGSICDPQCVLLKFPLQPGAMYWGEYELRRPRLSTVHTREKAAAQAGAWEEVTVPKGKFRALRIEIRGEYTRLDTPDHGIFRMVLWYVPAVKRWVKMTHESWSYRTNRPLNVYTYELVDYAVN